MDDGDVALTVARLSCGSCGTELPPDSRFCNRCGASIAPAATTAEYKQVTVLFADVVHSMDIAAAVGAERLREIMAELVERSTAVVHRYGGTVDKFTGDGIMAVFGAPIAMEDHAVRACLAALGIQEQAEPVAVNDRDGIELRLRVGLNSGQVIAGEIGSEAEAVIDRLASAQGDDSKAREIWLLRLRALLARATGEDASYRDYRDRYRTMATSLGFEGHMKWAEAMP